MSYNYYILENIYQYLHPIEYAMVNFVLPSKLTQDDYNFLSLGKNYITLSYLIQENILPITYSLLYQMIILSSKKNVELLLSHSKCPAINYDSLNLAVAVNKLGILVLLMKKIKFRIHKKNIGLLAMAAYHGHFKIMKFLIKHKHPLDNNALSNSIVHGNINQIEWFHSLGYKINFNGYRNAIKSQNHLVISWIKHHYSEYYLDQLLPY